MANAGGDDRRDLASCDASDVAAAGTVKVADATTQRDPAAAETVRAELGHIATPRSEPDVGSAKTVLGDGAPTDPGSADAPPFAPGTLLDEYIVGDVIGEGGMGVVVAARDPDLDRAVAIKLLRRGVFGSRGAGEARTRLLREAQAMAKLSHPNVITVYRVGAVDDQVFVAMELVDGGTLRAWCKGRSRGEILDAFGAAGRGLAAAHAAGLVHRDFKPDNALVGTDGRVRVTDFGLVGESPRPDAQKPARRSLTGLGLTQSGVVIGTPVYMAPEQHRGEPTDARADQFAFCVALYEALYGERPFAGDSYDELVDNVLANRVRTPARDPLPRRMRATLLRGMSPEPAQRFASMDELLAHLRPPSRTWLWVAAAAIAALGVGTTAWTLARGDAASCDSGRERLASRWDPARKASLRAAFEATHRPFAIATSDRVVHLLDAWTDRWVDMHDGTCRALVRHEQPEPMIERRTVCLERRLDEADRLISALIESPALDVAVKAVAGLSRVEDCASVTRLELIAPLPADPAARERIAALSRRLDDVRAADRLGRLDRALALAEQLAADVAATGYAPLVAAHLVARGRLEERATKLDAAVRSLRRAIDEAARAGDPSLEAEALSALLFTVGVRQGDAKRAEDLAIAGRSAVARAESPEQTVRFENVLAGIDQAQGRYQDARAHYERALELWDRSLAKDPTQFQLGAATHLNLGSLLADIGDTGGARAHYERARTIWSDTLGPDHPNIADVELDLGVLDAQLGDHLNSRAHHERALAIYRAAYGEDHERVATALSNLGDAIANTGDAAGALEPLARALAIRRKLYGDDNLAVAASYCTIGIALVHAGRSPGDELAKCRAIREAHLPAGHGDIAQVVSYIALAEDAAGKLDDAIRDYAIASKTYLAAGLHQEHAEQETNLGLAWARHGDRARAIEHMTASDAAWQAVNKAHPNAIDTRFRLAQLLADAGDTTRARALVAAARDAANGDQREILAKWLVEHAR